MMHILNRDSLPETVAPGDTIEIQIAPHGDFPGILSGPGPANGDKIVQRCSPEALAAIADAFSAEILVDRDHDSETGASTEAFGWITALRHDPETGLMASIKFTDLGAAAITNRRFRFVSPSFDVAVQGYVAIPTALSSLALTNKPNLPVGCVLNSAQADKIPPVEERIPLMDQLRELLGLDAEAGDEAILAAVTALKTAVDEAAAAKLQAEAEAAADANAAKIENRDAFIKLYVANRDFVRQMLAAVKAPPPPARVTNSATAARPPVEAQKTDVLSVYNSLSGRERRAYLRDHAAEIHAARAAAKAD